MREPLRWLASRWGWADAYSWYNDEHRHREIGYVTPNQRHNDQSAQVLEQRRQVYEAARQRHPERKRPVIYILNAT